MAKQKLEKELKLKISRRMDRDLSLVAEQAGLYSADVVRNAIRNEIALVGGVCNREAWNADFLKFSKL